MNQRLCVARSRKQGTMGHCFERAAGAAVCLAAVLLAAMDASAVPRTWVGTGVQDWFDVGNWSPAGFPEAGDEVTVSVSGASVVLTNETATLKSFSTSGTAALVFSNWTTRLRATTVTVGSGGTITCGGPFMNEAMSNRVHIVCSNLTVQTGGKINVNEKGYAGRFEIGQGPGGGYKTSSYPSGASHGGFGVKSSQQGGDGDLRLPYGSATAPLYAGSGGGGQSTYGNIGGHGGGAVRIEADGEVAVHGAISANATPDPTVYAVDRNPDWHSFTGGGSGGSIYITCRTFAGSNGSLAADGGKGYQYGGRGGGGRIAVVYDPSAQRMQPLPAVGYSVQTAEGGAMERCKLNIGTIYFSDTSLLPQTINGTLFGQVRLGVDSWSPDHLTVNNAWLALTQEGFQLTVTQNVAVTGTKGILELGGSETVISNHCFTFRSTAECELYRYSLLTASAVRVGGDLFVTNSARFYVYSAPTNATTPYGALVDVAGDVWVDNKGWIYPCSHPTQTGGAPLFRMRNLTVPTVTAGFDATGRGYFGGYGSRGYGDGGGNYVGVGGGGGYGGGGGTSSGGSLGGGTYGSSNAPAQPGSGGGIPGTGAQIGGNGGGLIAIEVQKNIMLNGSIQANGGLGGHIWGGGGSGGGIYLRCSRITGSGKMLADGGFGRWSWYVNPDRWIYSGSGGGGRIAVASQDASGWSGTATANGATNVVAQGFGGTGTVVWVSIPWPGSVMILR